MIQLPGRSLDATVAGTRAGNRLNEAVKAAETRAPDRDGRIGNDTTLAVRNYQRKIGIEPADGYAGVGLLARLRQGS